jgi:hypothetical protein
MISSCRSGEATPSVSRLPDTTCCVPPMSTSVMVLDSPGSNLTDAPEGTFRRLPMDKRRSNKSAAVLTRVQQLVTELVLLLV